MTIQQAAEKWGFSVNWIRALVKNKAIKAELRTQPMSHYWIDDDHPVPSRMRRSLKAEAAAAKAAKAAARRAGKAKGTKGAKAKGAKRATKRAPAATKAKRA